MVSLAHLYSPYVYGALCTPKAGAGTARRNAEIISYLALVLPLLYIARPVHDCERRDRRAIPAAHRVNASAVSAALLSEHPRFVIS